MQWNDAAWVRCAALFLGLLLTPAAECAAGILEEVVTVPVQARNIFGKEVAQEITVTVFRDEDRARAPFLLLNHGRSSNRAEYGRVRYSENARYFVSKGFVVLVPTRIGYGVSGGEDVEYSGNCSSPDYPGVFAAAARQGLAVIDHARGLPFVDAERGGLVVGQSFGGATSLALAAMRIPGVVAAVNFAGGSGGNPENRPGNPCRADRLEETFAAYGAATGIPTLWLYSENDRFFGQKYPREWFDAFIAKGGKGEFVALPPLGEDGHNTFTKNPAAWKPAFEAFLTRLGF